MPCGGGGGIRPHDGKGRMLCLPPDRWMNDNCDEDESLENCEMRLGSKGELNDDTINVLAEMHDNALQ